jgi:molybdenum cofactor cytidylyltransferase
MHEDFSVLVLAAGLSERMGFPKFLLKVSVSEFFIEKIINSYNELKCNQLILVVNSFDIHKFLSLHLELPKKLEIVINENTELGRFHSIQTGLKNLVFCKKVFIHNIDNPFVDKNICIGLLESMVDCDFIYPAFQGHGGHPILINENIIADILSTEINDINFKIFLNKYKKKTLNVNDPKILTNINTPDDYDAFKREFYK